MSELATALFAIVLISALAFVWINGAARSKGKLPPNRPEIPYRAYTKQFDVECHGSELDRVIREKAVNWQPSQAFETGSNTREDLFQSSYEAAINHRGWLSFPPLNQSSIILLVDQSGSMSARMPWVAGELAAAVEQIEGSGGEIEVVGFTTVGWHGGQSRQLWIREGRPEYPGRLCDLLYVNYKGFEEACDTSCLLPLALTSGLFENVDGETLRWAREKIKTCNRPSKAIVIVSDGAPVDDSTLQENGPAILWHDLHHVVAEIEAEGAVRLAGIGIEHDVSPVYTTADRADGPGELHAALIRTVANLV